MRSHKKYYYAFREYPNNCVVTVDDDTFYPSTLLKTLLENHYRHPQCVICNRGVIISMKYPYRQWHQVSCFRQPQPNILPTGVGGVLYPVGCYHEAIFDVEAIKSTCEAADDLWLSFMCRLKGTMVVHTGQAYGYITVLSSQKTALCRLNVGGGENDKQIKNISEWAEEKFHCDFYLNKKIDYERFL